MASCLDSEHQADINFETINQQIFVGNKFFSISPQDWFMGTILKTGKRTATLKKGCGVGGRCIEYTRSFSICIESNPISLTNRNYNHRITYCS